MKSVVLAIIILLVLGMAVSAQAGLLAHWKFDENTGTIASDSTGHGYDGTVVGTNGWVEGHIGNALNFPWDTVVDVDPGTGLDGLAQMSVSVWLYRNTETTDQRVCEKNGQWYLIIKYDGQVYFTNAGYPNPAIVSNSYLPAYEWTHLVVTGDKDVGRQIYINGVLDKSDTKTATPATSPYLFTIGARRRNGGSASYYYNGIMDDFRIYDHVLSEGEIEDLYKPTIGEIAETEGSTIVFEKNETSDTFDVVLTGGSPVSIVEVTVNPSINDMDIAVSTATENVGRVPGTPIKLIYDPNTWDMPQTVTVTAVDDAEVEGEETAVIKFHVTPDPNDDPIYYGGKIYELAVTVIDDEGAGVMVDPGDGLEVKEAGPTSDHYTIVLTGQPNADVNIHMSDDADPCQVSIDPETLNFTRTEWETPKTVTVTANDDNVLESASHETTVSYTVESGDLAYNGFVIPSTAVTILENDCGAWGFDPMDFNKDCVVGLLDFRTFAAKWLECSWPNDPACNDYR